VTARPLPGLRIPPHSIGAGLKAGQYRGERRCGEVPLRPPTQKVHDALQKCGHDMSCPYTETGRSLFRGLRIVCTGLIGPACGGQA